MIFTKKNSTPYPIIKVTAFAVLLLISACNQKEKLPNQEPHSANEKTLTKQSRTFNVLDYGAVGDDMTDNTEAFSSCLKAVVAAGGGRMYLPDGVYRGSIVIPPVSKPLPSWITVEIVGESEPTPVFGTIGSFPLQNNGTIVKSLSQKGPAAISASSSSNALYSEFSAVNVIIKNLEVRTYDNPGIGGIDLQYAMQCKITNVFINTGVYNVQASKPSHGRAA